MSSLLTHVSVSGWLDPVVKSTAVVLLAMVVAGLLGRASAAWRHLVWCLSVASLLLLPVLSLALPGWRAAWLPQWAGKQWAGQPTPLTEERGDLTPESHINPLEDAAIVPLSAAASQPAPRDVPHMVPPASVETARRPRTSISWLAVAWAAGGVLSLVPLAIGLGQLASLQRRSQAVGDHRWLTLLDELRRQLAVRRRVQLRECQSALAPLTWGMLRPVLLLPFDSHAWPEDRRRLVLLHELAHVRRWDWLTQLIAYAACAVYWFNPLVWFAASRMRIERARACDDIVLSSGARASDYAQELLALAAGLSNSQMSLLAAVPMASRRLLDDRLHGILDSRRNRAALTRTAVCLGVALAAAAVAPLAMLHAAPPESNESETSPASSPTSSLAPLPDAPESTQAGAPEAKKTPPAGRDDTLEMTVNTSRILTIGKPLPRVEVNNPDVVETTAVSETRIKITAKTPGITQVNLFDEDGNVYTVDTIVYPDARELKLSPRTRFPMDLHSAERQAEKADGDRDPLTLSNPEVQELWDLTMDEAVRTALTNSKVLRNLGGGLFKPVETQSKLKHAIKSTEDSKPVRGANVRIFLAPTNDDVALVDFETGLRNLLTDVERAYWDLYYNYRNLNAVQAGRDSALATWRRVHALYINGDKGGEAEAEAQAREQYFLFRAQVENTLNLLYTSESRLRYMMGLAPTDGRLIRPSGDPTREYLNFDWEEVFSEGLDSSVELRRQRDIIKQNELKLASARYGAESDFREAQQAVVQSKARLQELELELKHVLTNALRDLDRNYHVSRTTLNRRVAASRQVESVRAKYDVAAATVDMLLDAQRRLADAEIAYYRALVDYNLAILQVHYRKNSLLEYNGIMLAEGTSADSEARRK